jgi:anaerobic selenocysteine-containing dehydrogenase
VELWVVDPRQTETAQRANRYLAPRPGTDYAILGFPVGEILKADADLEFIEKHTQGVDSAFSSAMTPFL